MRSGTWMLLGASLALAGVLLLATTQLNSTTVSAGNQSLTPTVRAIDPCAKTNSQGGSDLHAAAVQQNCTETATPQRKAKTHTPTATATAAPKTATPVPPTAAPTNTPKPVQGNEGVSVKPPNTGSGDGAGSGSASLWLLVMGGAAVALGGGAFVVGVRRR